MKKVFVVDDDESIGEVVSQILELEGFSVKSFVAGKESVAQMKNEKPDLVLLDYFLPGENAEDTIKSIRNASGEKVPIVLMSASIQAEERAKSLPVSEFVSKPFQREALVNAIIRNIN